MNSNHNPNPKTIEGQSTNCYTDIITIDNFEYSINDGTFYIKGVTGYESFILNPCIIKHISKYGWTACRGTKPTGSAPRRDRLEIKAKEMKKVFIAENLINNEGDII